MERRVSRPSRLQDLMLNDASDFFSLKALWGLDWSEVPPTSKSGNETRNPRNFEQKSPTLEPRD